MLPPRSYAAETHLRSVANRRFLDDDSVCWGNDSTPKDSLGIKGKRSVMMVALRLLHYLGFRTVDLIGSGYFTIRPDGLIGDEPPSVTLTSPSGGSFAGGQVVPISWSAIDDEGVRSFSIQASYDGGWTWHFLAKELPGDENEYAWQLPPLDAEVSNVLVRIIVFDHRFQSASSTSDALTLTPESPNPADLNGDGVVSVADLLLLLGAWGPCGSPDDCPADLDGDGNVGVPDLLALLTAWAPRP